MPRYAALLRAVNLAGNNRVAMAELRRVCTQLGLGDVATYLQSGNVVFSSPETDTAALRRELEGVIASAFGIEPAVVLRSGGQLGAVLGANPFVEAGREASRLSVGFLAGLPEPERVRALLADPLASPPPGGDEFALRGEEVFLHHPNGYGRTKLSNSYFDRRLGIPMTVRNWRTVTNLAEMTKLAGV